MLVEIFESGEYEKVSFRGNTFIFTTCIGESIYSKSFTGNFSQTSLKEIVRAMNSDVVANKNIGSFATYVVRGLAKGKMIMFNYLENVVVRSLAQKQLEKTFENFAQRTDIDVKYNKKQLANLAMYMNDKDYNAKTITKLITEFLNKEMVDVFTQVNPKTQQPLLKTVKTIEYKIDMNSADKNAQEFFSERNREVLIICDKKDVHFYEAMTIPNVSIVCATDMNQAKQLLKKCNKKVWFFTISIGQDF
jgi:ATP-dependent Clp protease ATP-binding subunit ClpA